ncbi:MAG: universal stress protein [Syntrophobacteraceae bacterium]
MRKKILITVSDEASHLYGLRFVGHFFRNKTEVDATLFYVAPRSDFGETKPVSADLKIQRAVQKRAGAVLDTARQRLVDFGFAPENVKTAFTLNQFGRVDDIVRQARSGKYDAVVLGKRGYLFFQSIMESSVTRQILARELDFPIWICKNPQEHLKNVLVCVDGSEAALRMVDHVGFILGEESEQCLTLLHVDTGETKDSEQFLEQARSKLTQNGICDDRIQPMVVPSTNTGVAKKILEKAASGNYAAVGLGRVGIRKGGLTEWLVGSRAVKVIESIQKTSVWISS